MQFENGPFSVVGRRSSPPWQFVLLLAVVSSQLVFAAQKPLARTNPLNSEQQLQQHYDAARTFQVSGDANQAAKEYRVFLGQALQQVAGANASAGEYELAAKFLEDGLNVSPDSSSLQLELAYVRFEQQKPEEAEQLAKQVLKTSPKDIRALVLLGRAALRKGDFTQARESLEAAVVQKSTFDVGYLLGMTYVRQGDMKRAQMLFEEMVRGLGDSAQIHVYFGRAYADGDTEGLDNAVLEFKKAIAKDSKIAQAHYFLALAYLNRDGESGFDEAAPALEAELALNPNDPRARYLLGYIALKQHRNGEAERQLKRSAELDPLNPDPLLYLGQLYSDADRDQEAEATLRKAIELTKDVSRHNYQIARAQYVLGRILLRTGRKEEGEKYLAASRQLRERVRNDARLQPDEITPDSPGETKKSHEVSPEAKQKSEALIKQLSPSIADAYNNLGVILAGQNQFSGALDYFKKAHDWQPSLETLDRNLGMAAFYDKKFDQAVEPLARHLQIHGDDTRVRAALGLSYFMTQKFKGVLETLAPLGTSLDSDPGLAYAYAVSLVKTGNYDDGVHRLKTLEAANENSVEIHSLLGQAYADQNDHAAAIEEYKKSLALDANQTETHYLLGLSLLKSGSPAEAVDQFRTAVKMSPSDPAKKYHLAFSLVQLQQRDEARTLLEQVIEQDPKYADAYYELGKLQLEKGDVKPAITSFETGSQLSPDSDYIHYQLAMAYRRDSRTEDAEREIKLYQELKNRHRGRDVSQAN